MQIAFITMRYPWPSETFASRDIRALQQQGATVSVYTLRGAPAGADKLARQQGVAGTAVTRPGIASLLRGIGMKGPGLGRILSLAWALLTDGRTALTQRIKCLLLLPAAAAIAAELIRKTPEVVHIFWGHYPSLVLLLAKPTLPNTVFSLFLGAYDLEYKLGVSRRAAQQADCVFTHAHANLPAIRKLISAEPVVHVIHRGLDLSAYPAAIDTLSAKNPYRMITAGRLISSKKFDKVLNLFARVVQHHPQAALHIAGDGPNMAKLKNLATLLKIENNVRFLGWIDEQQMLHEMLQAKLFILLSEKPGECLPNVVKEAMATACVCIVTRSAGIDELIEHGKNGYLVEAGDDDSPVRHMLQHTGVGDIEPLQQSAFASVRNKFNAETSAAEYIAVWQSQRNKL